MTSSARRGDLEPGAAADSARGPAQLELTVSAGIDCTVIRADGVLDGPGGALLHGATAQLDPARLRHLELDLGGVTSADLAGVRALADLRAMLRLAGSELVIHNANPACYPTDWQVVSHTK